MDKDGLEFEQRLRMDCLREATRVFPPPSDPEAVLRAAGLFATFVLFGDYPPPEDETGE